MTKKKIGLLQMSKKEAQEIKSGYVWSNDPITGNICGCGCYYAGTPGGSTTERNSNANYIEGFYSPIK